MSAMSKDISASLLVKHVCGYCSHLTTIHWLHQLIGTIRSLSLTIIIKNFDTYTVPQINQLDPTLSENASHPLLNRIIQSWMEGAGVPVL